MHGVFKIPNCVRGLALTEAQLALGCACSPPTRYNFIVGLHRHNEELGHIRIDSLKPIWWIEHRIGPENWSISRGISFNVDVFDGRFARLLKSTVWRGRAKFWACHAQGGGFYGWGFKTPENTCWSGRMCEGL